MGCLVKLTPAELTLDAVILILFELLQSRFRFGVHSNSVLSVLLATANSFAELHGLELPFWNFAIAARFRLCFSLFCSCGSSSSLALRVRILIKTLTSGISGSTMLSRIELFTFILEDLFTNLSMLLHGLRVEFTTAPIALNKLANFSILFGLNISVCVLCVQVSILMLNSA